jgi:hypothetical protein
VLRIVVVCLSGLLVGATEARAALPAAHPPDQAKLARHGVLVAWPLTRSVRVRPLHRLVVPVRARKPVTVSLTAVDARGRHVTTLKRRTLRNGTFTATLYNPPLRRRLALRLDVAGQRYWSWVRLSRTGPVRCEHGALERPRIVAGPTSLRAGDTYTLRFRNDGRCPAEMVTQRFPWNPRWWRQTPSGWEIVRESAVAHRSTSYVPLFDLIGPGNERAFDHRAPGGLPAGRYRIEITQIYSRPKLQRDFGERAALYHEVDVLP